LEVPAYQENFINSELDTNLLRFRVILTQGINHIAQNYDICISKGVPATLNGQKFDCESAGSQLGENKGGLSDNFGRLSKSDFLYTELNLKKELDEGRVQEGDQL